LIPARDAITQVRKGSLLVVDVRPAAEFERFRIPGSLNIPPQFVKTKAFLKSQSFALVNEGRSSASLEQLCTDLRAAGYRQAAVVRGGINAWRMARGTVEGDLLAQRSLVRMRPSEYAIERAYPDWLVVNLSNASKDDASAFLPGAVGLSAKGGDKKFVAALKSTVTKRTRKGMELKVLIVDSDGADYEKLEPSLQGALANQVYFLDGGLTGYRKFWTEQSAIWAAAERPRRGPNCGT
jgi:rhodanese-related sulfurtransferase